MLDCPRTGPPALEGKWAALDDSQTSQHSAMGIRLDRGPATIEEQSGTWTRMGRRTEKRQLAGLPEALA